MVIGITLDDNNQMIWSWSGIDDDVYYSGFLTYFEMVNQLCRDYIYILNIQKVNESYIHTHIHSFYLSGCLEGILLLKNQQMKN